jgi:hypothetical protein
VTDDGQPDGGETRDGPPDPDDDILAEALLAEGECRLSRPFARVRPILTKAGLRFACTHDVEHMTKPIREIEAP